LEAVLDVLVPVTDGAMDRPHVVTCCAFDVGADILQPDQGESKTPSLRLRFDSATGHLEAPRQL
jgi:hypothetical protein